MSLRFYKRVSLIPGLRLNLSRSGASLSIGHRGFWYTVGPRGRRVTAGLPGSGLFYTEKIGPAAPLHAGHQSAFVLAVLVIGLLFLLGKFS